MEDLVQDGLSEQAALELLERRKQRNAPLTPLAWQAFKNEAEKINWTVEEAVHECLVRGWQSFKAQWVSNSKNSMSTAGFGNNGHQPTNKQIDLENRNAQVAEEWLVQQGIRAEKQN